MLGPYLDETSPQPPWGNLLSRLLLPTLWNLTNIDRHPIIADLDVEHNELAQTWKTFIRHLPPDDRVDWEHRPQTRDDVNALIKSLQSFWMTRPRQRVYSQVKVLCDQFLPTVDRHATLLARLPDSHLYHTPTFYGALQSVLKVSFIMIQSKLRTSICLSLHAGLCMEFIPANPKDFSRLHRIILESWRAFSRLF